MPLPAGLAAGLAVVLATAGIGTSAPEGEATGGGSSPSAATEVAVLPLTVKGELPERWYDEAGQRLVSGLSRGTLSVRAAKVPAPCDTPQCWSELEALTGVDFVVTAELEVGDARDYTLSIDARSVKTGQVVASTDGVCELCGFEEAVDMIESRSAVLAPELARLGAALPVLLFRSEPTGAVVSLDGTMYGPTPIRIQAPAGAHEVEATMAGYLPQSFSIEAVDGVRKEVALRLVPRPDDPLPQGRGLVIAGAVTLSAGVIGLATGVTLLVLDGREFQRRCEPDVTGRCQFDYETTIGGAVGTAIGGAGVAAGTTMLAVGAVRGKRARREAEQARVGVGAGGVRIRF